jgi:hypothetical protein
MASTKTWSSPTQSASRRARSVEGLVNYIGDMARRPRYYANDHSRDLLELDPRKIAIEDARVRIEAPSLAREGFELFQHTSEIEDFKDTAEVARLHPQEIEQLLLKVTGADCVVIPGPGVLRFGEGAMRAASHLRI